MRKRTSICVFVSTATCLVVALTADHGGLGYFSPQTLEYCTQSERTIAVLGVPIYRSRCEYHENELLALLIDHGYVKPQRDVKRQWKTVFHWNSNWRDGYGILSSALSRDRDELMAWTQANPEIAKVYWSEIFRLLRSEDPNDAMAGEGLVPYWRSLDTPDKVREVVKQIENELKT